MEYGRTKKKIKDVIYFVNGKVVSVKGMFKLLKIRNKNENNNRH